jgi:hypothetical protein
MVDRKTGVTEVAMHRAKCWLAGVLAVGAVACGSPQPDVADAADVQGDDAAAADAAAGDAAAGDAVPADLAASDAGPDGAGTDGADAAVDGATAELPTADVGGPDGAGADAAEVDAGPIDAGPTDAGGDKDPACCTAGPCAVGKTCAEGQACKANGELSPGQCWGNANCAAGESCVGANVCPCGAMCLVADKAGQCKTPGGGCTKVDPNSLGLCDMIVGWVWDGSACVLASGCGCGGVCSAVFPDEATCKGQCP